MNKGSSPTPGVLWWNQNKQYLQIFTIMIKHEKDKKRIKHIILDPFISKFIHKYT